ncbi:hypothetical protein [Cellulomonas chengniuliangii]|uniref:Uncharacterized protein n=1 Tax=Cellulomonas chengniuliangii TaxID=2968084 RepID=A0ABY5KXL7_9CELL|nr:hypothetical protein [Cellulomonas chengniuliangii]MCC2308643.1 hypothetical protein [Cellulomonas chengniuliangii]MCC2317660.1 hypothetical protein [Cellulomonas chengniuliangii]UUI74002.1 hypothetical protein NP064_09105 [Cellulomonas chengniuliangii]
MVMRPRWAWELDDAEGRVLDRPVSPVFTTQFDAEQWIGEQWRVLAGQGVHSARLLHDGHQATPTLALRVP